MEEEKLLWCLKIKTGVKLTMPSEEEYETYSTASKEDINNLKKGLIPQRWKPIVAYYSSYYMLYAILRLIGIKSENHFCSIIWFKEILNYIGEDWKFLKTIEKLRVKREKAQYYLENVQINISEIEKFVEKIESLKNKILLKKESIRNKIKELSEIANSLE